MTFNGPTDGAHKIKIRQINGRRWIANSNLVCTAYGRLNAFTHVHLKTIHVFSFSFSFDKSFDRFATSFTNHESQSIFSPSGLLYFYSVKKKRDNQLKIEMLFFILSFDYYLPQTVIHLIGGFCENRYFRTNYFQFRIFWSFHWKLEAIWKIVCWPLKWNRIIL